MCESRAAEVEEMMQQQLQEGVISEVGVVNEGMLCGGFEGTHCRILIDIIGLKYQSAWFTECLVDTRLA